MDYGDKLPPSPQYIFTPPRRYIFTPPLTTGRGKFVFVTSTTHTGDLGGIAGGDGICNDRAADAGLPGVYKAWLATSDADAPTNSFAQATGLIYGPMGF